MKKLNSGIKEQGFTLIEVLIAMVILSIAIIALTSMQTAGIKGNSTAQLLTTAGTWGADAVERVFVMDYDLLADGSETSPDGNYTISWDVTEDDPMPATKRVDITVTAKDVDTQRNVEINYIRAKYVK